MPTEVSAPRALTADDLDAFCELDEITFITQPRGPAELQVERSLLELDRAIGVFDGPDIVGGAAIYSFEMTVPGGRVPMAGVSWVSVLPTHRRRGILSSMMRYQLHELHETGGEALAGLTASEPPIYGRFGYGPATKAANLTVPRHRNALRLPEGTGDVTIRLISTPDSVPVCEEIYARQVTKRAGMLVRTPAWGAVYAADPEAWREGRSKLRTVLAERDGQPVGFARYRTKYEGTHGVPAGRVDVQELYGDDPAAEAALLRYVLDIDLTAITSLMRLPLDAAPVQQLTYLRAAQMTVDESLYLRLVDVDRALSSRTYSAQIDIVIEVADLFCPWNEGRWRLTGDEKGAHCERTDAAPDLAIGIRELGASYLGGVTLASLDAAGLVDERRPGALAEASRAFSIDLQPSLPFGF
ncbi:MAG: GNAT family N-acetyltransferase [Actinocrinis sp.]